MRFLVFFGFLFLFVSTTNAQLPKKLKYDELIYSYDSTTVVIRKGLLNSVYDLELKEYLIAPTKSTLINFAMSNFYAEIELETNLLSIHFLNNDAPAQVFGSEDSCYLGVPEPYDGALTKFEIIKCVDGNYILNHYYAGEMYGADSLVDKKTGATVTDGYYRISSRASGVYNLELKKSIIEPTYKRCYHLNGFVFCLNENYRRSNFETDFYHPNPYFYSYDIFQLLQDSVRVISKSSLEIEPNLLAAILIADTLHQCDEPNHFIVELGGKKGLVRLQLFDSENSQSADFVYSVVIRPTADYIIYSPFYHKVVAMFSDSLKPLVIYDYDLNDIQTGQNKSALKWRASDSVEVGMKFELDLDSATIILTKKQEFKMDVDSIGEPILLVNERSAWTNSFFGLELQKNGYLVVNNWCPSYSNMPKGPLMSILYPGEDSVYNDPITGEYWLVYPPDAPGFIQSGVMDFKNNRWIIEPKCNIVNPNERYYFLQTGLAKNGWEEIYSIVDSTGNLVASSVTYSEIVSDPALLKYALQYPSDSIFVASLGFGQHTKFEKKYPGYYYTNADLLGLYQPSVFLENLWEPGLYEFIHHNPELNFTYFLKGDSIYFKSPQMNLSVSKKNGKIIFVQPLYYEEPLPNFELYQIENNDTIFYGEKKLIDGPVTVSSISMRGDLLIINDHTSSVDNSCIERFAGDSHFYTSELHFESESSSAWKITENGWRKISADYATLIPIKNGEFIASSGYFYEQTDFSGKWVETEISKRYFLLDSNFNAISYMDYFDFPLIEDLGFGLKVCMDNADCFFMTYNRVAVTNAEWDNFELYNKKLKAIKKEVPAIDADGVPMFDEFGAPINTSESVIMFFKIP